MPKLLVHDPGHGGHDPGAFGHGLKEKELLLAICKRASAALRRDYQVEIALTREDNDTFLELNERAQFANERRATAFVSVHINSAANSAARGFETYRHTGAAEDSHAARLQGALHEAVLEAMRRDGVADRKEKTANFAVLRETRMPAILTENLFISNPGDAALLRDDAFLARVAEAHATGIARALSLPPKGKDIHRVTADGVAVGTFRKDDKVGTAVVEAIKKGARRIVVEEIQPPS